MGEARQARGHLVANVPRVTQAAATAPGTTAAKLTLPTLTTMVVGSMVGAACSRSRAASRRRRASLTPLIAWAVAGTGMLMLAFVFQTLAVRRPDLDAGVYAYAKAEASANTWASSPRSATGPVPASAT